jgi:transcriptional regulator with XRE-family HTH domain
MVGDNIKQIRISKKLGLNELAKKSNISGSYLSNIEKGIKNNPSIDALNNIADALDVSIEDLFSDSLFIKEEPKEPKDDEPRLITSKPYYKDKTKKKAPTLDIVPEQFTNPIEARAYISKHRIFSSEGFDVNKLSDEDVLEFGNALLEQMKMVSYKYKK